MQQSNGVKKTALVLGDKIKPREKWANKIEFILACVGFCVGLGNAWRFPYLCYKNGGGAFFIPYAICLVTAGIPIFILEVGLGQYASQGGITVWDICPLFKGIGYGTTVVCSLLNIFYIIVLSWSVLYLYYSFTAPWGSCDNDWNTPRCFFKRASTDGNRTSDMFGMSNVTESIPLLTSMTSGGASKVVDPVVEFWERKVLQISSGIDEPGDVRWELALTLLIVWVLCYFCICKGVKTSGKVVYFTATFPYLILTVLLIRGVTLPGASEGIIFYLNPDFTRLLDAQVWIDAGTQIFFSYAVALGCMTALGSYNDFHNDFYKQCILISVCNSGTSIYAGFAVFSVLGHMAQQMGVAVKDVATSGPGLVFITYPRAIAELDGSQVWAVLFFVVILFLGLDSQFVGVEGVITAVVDALPQYLRRGYRREIFVGVVCLISYLLGLCMVTNGGMYVFQLFDYYAASGFTLLWFCFLECIVVGWIYGADKFYDNIEEMIGYRISPWCYICWKYLCPLVTGGIFLFCLITFKPIKYGRDYEYPMWANLFGWCLALMSMICVPIYIIYKMSTTSGTMRERWVFLTAPQWKNSNPQCKDFHLEPAKVHLELGLV